jgi:hypothetical protein
LELVRDIEKRWKAGKLAEALGDEDFLAELSSPTQDSYRGWLGQPYPAWREGLFRQLAARFSFESRPPARTFEIASVDLAPRANTPAPDVPDGFAGPHRVTSLHVLHEGSGVNVRVDQALAVRVWGLWFEFGDFAQQWRLEEQWAEQLIARFEVDLRVVNCMSPEFAVGACICNPREIGSRFEQLVRDILNEAEPVAFPARLEEDLFEKTDMRVRVRGLDRKRGVRLQVTTLAKAELHAQKVTTIQRSEDIIILSPLTLAFAAKGRSGTHILPGDEARRLFESLGAGPVSVEALAHRIKTTFLSALEEPFGPLGPLTNVPGPVRQFVRAYVAEQAHVCTRSLRQREFENPGRPSYTYKKRRWQIRHKGA